MINVGVIGYGYWGPNLVRNFNSLPLSNVKKIADIKKDRRTKASLQYPHIEVVSDANSIINDPEIDAVLIATPVQSHYSLAKKALEAGKHVLVEKPLAASIKESEELVNLAQRKNLILMVDHTFIYTDAVRKIKEIIKNGIVGRILYFDSIRVNLGLFQPDVNVIWDLAPHDLSILEFLIEKDPEGVVATGTSHFNPHIENIAYLTLYYENGVIAHINVSWLAPVKIRLILIGGDKKMIVYNDTEPSEKVKVYDKGVNFKTTTEDVYRFLVEYRTGDVWVPKLSSKEALYTEAEHFIECIEKSKTPITDGEFGLKIVKILALSEQSLKNRGKFIQFK